VKGATKDKALFVFDEPTTGLHFHDIKTASFI
jgi:excinuclease ABC subunit A